MTETTKRWADTALPFFTLTPARLAEAMQKAMHMDNLSPEKILYCRGLLLHTASNATLLMEEKLRNTGALAARKLSPAHSMAHDIHQDEAALYELINSGDANSVRRIVSKQKFTATAHPNFSRSRELTQKCKELTTALARLTREEQLHIEMTGTLPQGTHIAEILAEMKPLLGPREKRTRRDELQETTIDVIPSIMQAATQQMALFKQRRMLLSEKTRYDSAGQIAPAEFTSVKQLDAAAELLPDFQSWFLDGDGKRTCHVYDAEVAIPAIKRATYKQYAASLANLPDKLGNLDIERWRRRLASDMHVMKEVEELAATRMNALNAFHEAYKIYKEDTSDIGTKESYTEATKTAQKASRSYMQKLHSKLDDGRSVIDLLKQDAAGQLRDELSAELSQIYSGEASIRPTHRETAEDLYIKLKAYGNFAISLQRRENAQQYKEVLEYILQNSAQMQKELAEKIQVDPDELLARMETPALYTKVVEDIASSALSADDPMQVREHIRKAYKRLSSKLEKNLRGNGEGEKIVIKPLQDREFLTLDALGCFNMARLYPEAFRSGSVIAEFGQPDIDTLRTGDAQAIRHEVVSTARTDMLTHLAYSHAMGAPHIGSIPLHEDPATMRYAPEAQEILREEPIRSYLLNWIGVHTPEEAQAHTVLRLNNKGKPIPMTAYEELRGLGCSEEEMTSKGLDIRKLKKTLILRGPEDMEAASDIGKRYTIAGSKEAEQSVRDKAIAAARCSIRIGDTEYMIKKPKYVGEGGAIARASRPPVDTEQVTRQGEHLHSLVPDTIAHDAMNAMLARFALKQRAARDETLSTELRQLAAERPGHTGNVLGFPGYGMTPEQRELLNETGQTRINATRDDPRYNDFLAKYGEPAPNHSARPNAKTGRRETFNSGRAIGIAAKESGIWANVIGISALFDFGTKGEGKGKVTQDSAAEIRRWKDNDHYIQHLLTAAALVANFVNLKEKWQRGDIEYANTPEGATLSKSGQSAKATVKLETLLRAYRKGDQSYIEPSSGVTFDAADLVMAHLTDQFHKLCKGLHAVYPGHKDMLELFDEAHRPTIMAYKALYDDVLKALRETKGRSDDDRKLLEGAYYVLFEGGSSIFPMPALREQGLYKQAKEASR